MYSREWGEGSHFVSLCRNAGFCKSEGERERERREGREMCLWRWMVGFDSLSFSLSCSLLCGEEKSGVFRFSSLFLSP